MYKFIPYLRVLWIVLFIFIGPRTNAQNPSMVERGVSLSLAKQRKATLTNLNYKLRFSIPYALTQSVKGFAIIEFNSSDTTQDLILDFAQDSTHLHYLAINQHVCMPKIENGHIRLPKEQIRLKNNQVFVHFTSANRPLNRRSDLLYTLLVPNKAAQVFPCFDQADLKAHYTLELEIPKDWEAVANSPCLEHCSSSCFDSLAFYAQNLEFVNFTNNLVEDSLQTHDRENLQTQNIAESYKRICFSPTELLPTYLFSFVVGKLQKETFFEDGRKIHIYHRETDTTKIAQCKDIAKQVYQSLQWLEDYTQIAYPFTKYDLIILAGFQYGGMEHTGATLYNAKYLFLPSNANIKDQIKRAKLIAHETAHLWFGNYVTMEWFNDVWMKEVFANFFASKMLPSLCGEVDQELNRILDLYPSAYLEDRTSGTNAIQQKLDNMQDAALIYGNIIYDKSPIVFDMLYKKMGELSFKSAIRDYLQTFSYGNASWDQLIHIFSRYTSSSLINWSEAWVKQKGMPYIQIDYKNNKVTITQTNLYKTHQLWEQNLCLRVKGEGQEEVRRILLNTHTQIEEFPFKIDSIFPNIDAQTYGYIQLDSRTAKNLLTHLNDTLNEIERAANLICLYENALQANIFPADLFQALLSYIPNENNTLLFCKAIAYLNFCYVHYPMPIQSVDEYETCLWKVVYTHPDKQHKLIALRNLYEYAWSLSTTEQLYKIWFAQKNIAGEEFSERDWIQFSYQLAIRIPSKANEIIRLQKKRLHNPDQIAEYEFVSQALTPDIQQRDVFFSSLLKSENRYMEPWVLQALALLNHPLRQKESIHYIYPALSELKEIQKTSDIFFATQWSRALLQGHHTPEARNEVMRFWQSNPNYPSMLGCKIRQSSDHLYRKYTSQKQSDKFQLNFLNSAGEPKVTN